MQTKFLWLQDEKNRRMVFLIGLVTLFILGAAYRIININTALYGDETQRVLKHNDPNWWHNLLNNLASPPLAIGNVLMRRLLINISPVEWVLRLQGLIPGLLSIWITYLLAKEIFRSRLVILFTVAVVALNPRLVDYSKELKIFMYEFFICLLLVYFLVKYVKTQKSKYLTGCFLTALFASVSAMPALFFMPVLFILPMVISIQKKNYKQLAYTLSAGVVVFMVFLLHYIYIIHKPGDTNLLIKEYYEGFYVDKFSILGYIKWILLKLFRFGHYAISFDKMAMNRGFIPEIKYVIAFVSTVFYLGGIIILLRRRKWLYLSIFFSPILLLYFMSIIKKWPFEPDRMNIFVIGNFIFLFSFFLDYIRERVADKFQVKSLLDVISLKTSRLKLLPILIFLLFFGSQYAYNIRETSIKHNTEEINRSLEYIYKKFPFGINTANLTKKMHLAVYISISTPYKYYTEIHPHYSKKMGQFFKENFRYEMFGVYAPNKMYALDKNYYKKNIVQFLLTERITCFLMGKYIRYRMPEIHFIEKLAKMNVLRIIGKAVYRDSIFYAWQSNIYAGENLDNEKLKVLIEQKFQELNR